MKIFFLKVNPSFQVDLLVFFFASLMSQAALADLIINPTRIVFEKNQRSAQIDVINDGTTAATYRLNIVNRRMTNSGEFQPITEPGDGDQFAGPMLIFSPRQIVLQPGTQQLVRIALRKPADLAPGEYRSHLSFDRIADPTVINSIEAQMKPSSNEVGVVTAALIGISIPIIVRQGEIKAQVTLSGISLEKPKIAGQSAFIVLQMNRTGQRSVYGDLTATFQSASGGAELLVAQAGGVAVYVPNTLRRVSLTLQVPAGTLLAGGVISVSYKERTADGGKLLAENTLQIP